MHIWGNPNLNLVLNPNMFKHNIRYIADLYQDGEKRKKEEFKAITNQKIMFTEYFPWFKATQNSYNTTIFPNSTAQHVKMPLTINLLPKDKRGTKY